LFSSSKQVASECQSLLGADWFEQILIMKSVWQGSVVDLAAMNSNKVEEIDLNEFGELLQADNDAKEWDKEDNEFIFDSDNDLYYILSWTHTTTFHI
jgi:hypothetical protein